MRFNPPPNWPPPPPGWQPDAYWRPPAEWGPPPVGWPLWVPEQRRTGLVIFVCAALAVLLAGGAALTLFLLKPWETEGDKFAASITCSAENAAEEQVCDAIRSRYAGVVDGDTDRVRKYTCSLGVPYQDENALAALRSGKVVLSVTSVEVQGDTAYLTLKVDERGGKTLATMKFKWKKEGGTWKACSGPM